MQEKKKTKAKAKQAQKLLTVVSIFDKKRDSSIHDKYLYLCSRCGKRGVGNEIVIKPNWIRETRRGGKIYIYHMQCIRTSKMSRIINTSGHHVLALLELLKRKIILWNTIHRYRLNFQKLIGQYWSNRRKKANAKKGKN